MSFDLMDAVRSAVPAGFAENASGSLGETPQATHHGIEAALSSIVGGVSSKAESPQGAAQVYSTMKDGGFLSGGFNPQAAYGAGGAGLAQAATTGHGLLGSLFGADLSARMAEQVSRTSGVKSSSASTLLSLGAPLVMGVLGRQLGSTGGVAGLTSLLHGQRQFATGAGGAANEPAAIRGTETGRPEHERLRPVAAQARGSRWLVPVVIAIGVIAVGYRLAHRSRRAIMVHPVAMHQPRSNQPGVGGGGPVGQPVVLSGTSTAPLEQSLNSQRALPQQFILEDVQFRAGSANLSGNAKDTLDKVAGVIRQHPNAKFAVEGRPDISGTEGTNQRLAQKRAEVMRDELVRSGVNENQIQARGVPTHPAQGQNQPPSASLTLLQR